MYDFIVVGLGLAGWAFTRVLDENRKRFVVFDPCRDNASTASAGVYNPVILKRFTMAWKAAEFLPYGLLQYRRYEMETGRRFVYPLPIYRKLASAAEQNDWQAAAGRPGFEQYMDGIRFENFPGIEAPFGFGITKNTGLVDVRALLQTRCRQLEKRGLLMPEKFDYRKLQIGGSKIRYGEIEARRIVFAEGFGMKRNPFFGHLPLMGTKGETLRIRLPHSGWPVIKSNVFLAPIPASDEYLTGATYEWEDKTTVPTDEARKILTGKLEKLYSGPYTITGQTAGIRPTVKDRRPLLGVHPEYPGLAVFNGLGTRGLILAPRLAKMLFEHLEFGMDLLPETDIKRWEKP